MPFAPENLSHESILFLINHIFLPPQLPQADDISAAHENLLLEITITALRKFRRYVDKDVSDLIQKVTAVINSLHSVRDGSVDNEENTILRLLRNLPKSGQSIALHIRAQNAAIIMTEVDADIHILAFELSPTNESVLATTGRLRRTFPGTAIAIPTDVFQQADFQKVVARTLTKMSQQEVNAARPQTRKGGNVHIETRDTTHPKIITQLLVSFLEPIGRSVSPSHLWKNTREEVMWSNALHPWRRAPLWLLIRVALQLEFKRHRTSETQVPDLYKSFMIFLMGMILQLSIAKGIACDLLHVMNCKLGRRLLKLDPTHTRSEIKWVCDVMKECARHIGSSWEVILRKETKDNSLAQIPSLTFGKDVSVSLPALNSFIESIATRNNIQSGGQFKPDTQLAKYTPSSLPNLSKITGDYLVFNLLAFEQWVAESLPAWIENHQAKQDSVLHLADLMDEYFHLAAKTYCGYPEKYSVLLLTIIEIWVACDRCATYQYKLIKEYDPGVPPEVLQTLILPHKDQMHRLLKVEEYLSQRRVGAYHPFEMMFLGYGKTNSFAVRFYSQSLKHQQLRQRVETDANQAKTQKLQELTQKQQAYRSLMEDYDQTQCEQYEHVSFDEDGDEVREWRHSRTCQRCKKKKQADNISIDVYEWPLPRNDDEASTTIFELLVPRGFARWRDSTFKLLTTVLKFDEVTAPNPCSRHTLDSYSGLQSYYVYPGFGQCIIPLSETKPHDRSHYKSKKITEVDVKDVCPTNGLQFKYFNSSKGKFLMKPRPNDDLADLLMYKLPIVSSSIQTYLRRPHHACDGPSPNSVIANQSNCPKHMTLDEYKQLCNITLGHRIQWQNILLQLATPSVDFKKVETSLIILQALYQAGPAENKRICRVSHEVVKNEEFARALLHELEDNLANIKENWESSQALCTYISIAARMLSLSTTESIQHACLNYLQKARQVAFEWVRLLNDKVHTADDDSHKAEFKNIVIELALTCASSFCVDNRYLRQVFESTEKASIFIQCCLIIHDGEAHVPQLESSTAQILFHRWQSLCFRSHLMFAKNIAGRDRSPLDDAISEAWTAYINGPSWKLLSSQCAEWLTKAIVNDKIQGSQVLHYSLIRGKLLVNGLPLAQLPSDYLDNPTYQVLFGRLNCDVMPTTAIGMQFSGKRLHAGHTVHFGMQTQSPTSQDNKSDFLVQASKDSRTRHLIPCRLLRDQFPTHFVDNFIHWYEEDEDCVEFCPVADPWSTSEKHWKLIRSDDKKDWLLKKDKDYLVNFKNPTASTINSILSSIELSSHIHITWRSSTSFLEVDLPRISISFFIRQGSSRVESKQFRGSFIDENQSIGSLVGLKSKLVLRTNDSPCRRQVIIPEGKVSYKKEHQHVLVTIDQDSITRIHVYEVDELIGRLLDNGTLQTKLWLCYMHALTSFCIPDPLLLRTGTEQALTILKSAAVRSFDCLTSDNVGVLQLVAACTPGRNFYPPGRKVMQTLNWDPNLSFLCQHGWFYQNVQAILDQASRQGIYHKNEGVELPRIHHVEQELLKRDCLRTSAYRVSGFGAEDFDFSKDTIYSCRDRSCDNGDSTRAYAISYHVFHQVQTLSFQMKNGWGRQIWQCFEQVKQVCGATSPLHTLCLRYDAALLGQWSGNLYRHWIALHETLCNASNVNKYEMMIWLATLAFGNEDMTVLQAIACFYVLPAMSKITIPSAPDFKTSAGLQLSKHDLLSQFSQVFLDEQGCPKSTLTRHKDERQSSFQRRCDQDFKSRRNDAFNNFFAMLEPQWPSKIPIFPQSAAYWLYIDKAAASNLTTSIFQIGYQNHEIHQYLQSIESTLRCLSIRTISYPQHIQTVPKSAWTDMTRFVSIENAFNMSDPRRNSSDSVELVNGFLVSSSTEREATRLTYLIDQLGVLGQSKFELDHIRDLQTSLEKLKARQGMVFAIDWVNMLPKLPDHAERCESNVQQKYSCLSTVTETRDRAEDCDDEARHRKQTYTILAKISHFPRFSPQLFLQQLSRKDWPRLSLRWKKGIVDYALSLTMLQKARRLSTLTRSSVDMIKELRNQGHTNWDPFQNPEWLLLEVESGVLIRDVQASIAHEMRKVVANKTMQLNMGEGKSSVIVPAVATSLAHGSQLVRVITAKPQARQMFQMLVSKLGGLLDRRIYHMPFSRSVGMSTHTANLVAEMCKECMESGGVLLVQPEQLLSFKLMGLEALISGRVDSGASLLRGQELFRSVCRDVIDESDENYSVKFELIYTMGLQRPIQLSPQRWTTIQEVLYLTRMIVYELAVTLSSSLEVNAGVAGAFPRTRILDDEGETCLIGRIAQKICDDGINNCPIARQPQRTRESVYVYLTQASLSNEQIAAVEQQGSKGFWSEATSQTLLLLRGLLAGGVLAFTLRQKRWRVQYGLDKNRTPRTTLAVPYKAKDSPTLRSEFSHPDVVIILTCFSHYYGGLENDDLFSTFAHLLKSDHADMEYQEWMKDASSMPPEFCQLGGINIKDRLQCIEKVFPPLRFAKNVVDYFLSQLVFPKEVREFPDKLSASGWDIGEAKTLPSSGFSGTTDSKITLPLDVSHLDLVDQKHTDALVLENLLRPENSVMLVPSSPTANGSMADNLLNMVIDMEPQTRVILDVGAQVLELTNKQVATQWLTQTQGNPKVQAVVYVDDNDDICVIDRKGHVETLQTSSYSNQLDLCLVFLDEAHTRGIDLRLPDDYRAAVTLGANLTKDRLVQACMRMRKLGNGQSIVFCVPKDIDRRIRTLRNSHATDAQLCVQDVLCWAITETWQDMKRSIPLWAAQGRRFVYHQDIYTESRASGAMQMSTTTAQKFLEPESQSLEQRYQPGSNHKFSVSEDCSSTKLSLIADRCKDFVGLEYGVAQLEEEQERELSPEVVREREVQHPPPATPADHTLSSDVILFVKTGSIRTGSVAIRPAFEVLRSTSASRHISVSQFPKDILATTDFTNTIITSGAQPMSDSYQRPVQWVLTSVKTDESNSRLRTVNHMVIISPFEAQKLLTQVKVSKQVALHMYAPRPNLCVRPLDSLDLYTVSGRPSDHIIIPEKFITQLNLFAGQLYMKSFQQYLDVCDMLGLASQKIDNDANVAADGFILPPPSSSKKTATSKNSTKQPATPESSTTTITNKSTFTKSPVMAMRVFMTKVRRNCTEIDKTHMGAILGGRLLNPEDFEDFRTSDEWMKKESGEEGGTEDTKSMEKKGTEDDWRMFGYNSLDRIKNEGLKR